MNQLAAINDQGHLDPGFYRDLSNHDYHVTTKAWSSSWCKKILESSPAKVMWERNNPTPPTESMRLGTAVHSLVLEPEKFDQDNQVIQTNYWKDAQEAQKANPGINIISKQQEVAARKMAENVLKHPDLGILFEDGWAETSVYQWYNGIDREDYTPYRTMVKVRPDFISRGHPSIMVDLKSARDASASGFADAVIKYRYDLSAAMYMHTCNSCPELLEALNIPCFTNFIFVVVENTPPYQVAWYELMPDDMDFGRTLYETAMWRLHQAKRKGWPGYKQERQFLELPPYSRNLKVVGAE